MALLATQGGSTAPSADLVYSNASASDTFKLTGRERVHIRNANVGAVTATFVGVGRCSQGALHDLVVTIPAAHDRFVGNLDVGRFADPDTHIATVTFSPNSSVTVAILA